MYDLSNQFPHWFMVSISTFKSLIQHDVNFVTDVPIRSRIDFMP